MIRTSSRRAVLGAASLLVATMLPVLPPTAVTSAPATAATSASVTVPPIENATLAPEGSRFSVVEPQRVMAPRVVAGGTTYTLSLSGVPTGATAVALNLTVAKVTSRTYVSACPGGTTVAACRSTSTVNAEAGENVANHVVVKLGGAAGDELMFYVDRGSPTLIADLQGRFITALGAPLAVDGAPVRVSTDRERPVVLDLGHRPAGQAIGVRVQVEWGSGWVSLYARQPNGEVHWVSGASDHFFWTGPSGNYALVLQPHESVTRYVVTASTPIRGPDVTLDGPAVQVHNERPGQPVDMGVVELPAQQRLNVSVGTGFRPDLYGLAQSLATEYSPRTTWLGRSGEAGSRRMMLLPWGNAPISTTLTLSRPLTAAAMTVDGPSLLLSEPRAGQEVLVPLAGHQSAGTELDIHVSSASGSPAYVDLVGPSGAVSVKYGTVISHTLPTDGTYSLRAHDYQGASLTVTTPRTTQPLVVDGDAVDLPALRPGQRMLVPVQRSSVDRRVGFALEVPGNLSATVRNSEGVVLTYVQDRGDPVRTAAIPPTAGELVVQLQRYDEVEAPGGLLASSPLRAEVVVDGPTLSVPQARAGQEVEIALPLAAGDKVDLTGPQLTRVLSGDQTVAYSYDGGTIALQPQTATAYSVRLEPLGAWSSPPQLIASRSLELGPVLVGGPPVEVPSTRPGQRVLLSVPQVQAGTSHHLTLRRDGSAANVRAEARDAGGKFVGSEWLDGPVDVMRLWPTDAAPVDVTLTPFYGGVVGPGSVEVTVAPN